MIKICKAEDIQNIKDPALRPYVEVLLNSILFQYQNSTGSIESIGAIFIVESKKDLRNYRAFGLSSPLSERNFEYMEPFGFGYLNGCIVLNNSTAINIIGKHSILKEFLGKEE